MALRARTDWPRKRNGLRRRSSAPQVLRRGRVMRPAGWLFRLALLCVIAIPSPTVSNRMISSTAISSPRSRAWTLSGSASSPLNTTHYLFKVNMPAIEKGWQEAGSLAPILGTASAF